MNAEFRVQKQAIRNFMQAHYTDDRLAQLLAHAQSGRLSYDSCCCFIGIPTNFDHALRSGSEMEVSRIHGDLVVHSQYSRDTLVGAVEAELAFRDFGAHRNRLLIPMIRAEMRRRDKLRSLVTETATLQSV